MKSSCQICITNDNRDLMEVFNTKALQVIQDTYYDDEKKNYKILTQNSYKFAFGIKRNDDVGLPVMWEESAINSWDFLEARLIMASKAALTS